MTVKAARKTRVTERLLDERFRSSLDEVPGFAEWILSKTKFAGVRAKLVNEPWKFQWYKCKNTGVESETDIFLIFRNLDTSERFALHIENKLANGKFLNGQPWLYHKRGTDWITRRNYQDFETVLIAPESFYHRYKAEADIFHRFISHEEIAAFVPEFST